MNYGPPAPPVNETAFHSVPLGCRLRSSDPSQGLQIMPLRQLSRPHQFVDWLDDWGKRLEEPASMTLIGSAADLLVPKLKRNEPRDRAHANWARSIGIA